MRYSIQSASEKTTLVREAILQGDLHDPRPTNVPGADMLVDSHLPISRKKSIPRSLFSNYVLRHVGGSIVRSHGFCFFHDRGAPWFFEYFRSMGGQNGGKARQEDRFCQGKESQPYFLCFTLSFFRKYPIFVITDISFWLKTKNDVKHSS